MLTRLQTRLFTIRVSLYKPGLIMEQAGDLEADDAQTQYTPAYKNVPCWYESTPELDVAGLDGRTAESNLFTLDKWWFVQDQPLADTWIILITGSDPRRPPHPYIGRTWVVRNNPQVIASQGRRPTNMSWAYALLEDVPGLSTPVAGIS